jgi:curved DNA-binding protein CbpA
MAENNNPYSILGVTKGISDKDLKTAYVNLVKKYDPEKHTERFMVIQAAYDKLRNPAGRAKEDLLTFNAPKGEYIFNGDERCVDNQGPEAAVLAKARADYRGEPGNETHRATLLRLLAQHAHHHVIRKMFVEAIRDWDEMLEIDPSHIRARHNLQLADPLPIPTPSMASTRRPSNFGSAPSRSTRTIQR